MHIKKCLLVLEYKPVNPYYELTSLKQNVSIRVQFDKSYKLSYRLNSSHHPNMLKKQLGKWLSNPLHKHLNSTSHTHSDDLHWICGCRVCPSTDSCLGRWWLLLANQHERIRILTPREKVNLIYRLYGRNMLSCDLLYPPSLSIPRPLQYNQHVEG